VRNLFIVLVILLTPGCTVVMQTTPGYPLVGYGYRVQRHLYVASYAAGGCINLNPNVCVARH
jgi:uncharacterized protein YceK